jgi:hypothetical protein
LLERSNEWNGGKDDSEGKTGQRSVKFPEMSTSSTREITMVRGFLKKKTAFVNRRGVVFSFLSRRKVRFTDTV